MNSSSLHIEHIRVRRGRIDLRVRCDIDALHVSARQARYALELLPNLSNHICVNGAGETFGEEIAGTELPHLLEHIIIELQRQAGSDAARLGGHTSWLEELAVTAPHGYALMRTTVSFEEDFVALQALKDALELIDEISGYATAP